MRKLNILVLLCAILMAVPHSISAQTDVMALYETGEYDAAVRAAEQLGGSDNYAIAARALNAVAYFAPDRKSARRAAGRAYEFSKLAIERDPMAVEARLQAAISMAVRGANMAPARAFILRLPRRSRRYIDEARVLDEQNPWVLSTSAAWHLEVSRRGGARVYDADPELGFQECQLARMIDPANVVIAYECALRLLAFGRGDWRDEALEALSASTSGTPKTEFEAAIQRRAFGLEMAIEKSLQAERAFITAQP